MSAHPLPPGWLMAYHDGELEAARRDRVAAHLAQCAECRRELAELSALSQALAAADPLPPAAAGPEAFWARLQPRLDDSGPRLTAPADARRVLLRWLPGVGLLLLNGLAQVLALALAGLVLLPLLLAGAPAWAGGLAQFAAGAALGWPAWLLPSAWAGWVLFGVWLMVSLELAVLYLAWLGYELRHGPLPLIGRAAV